MSIERDRDLLDVEIAEKRLELYDAQGGAVVEATEGTEQHTPTAPVATPFRLENLRVETPVRKIERGWFHLKGSDGKGQFVAVANVKGSSSLRRFDAGPGAP